MAESERVSPKNLYDVAIPVGSATWRLQCLQYPNNKSPVIALQRMGRNRNVSLSFPAWELDIILRELGKMRVTLQRDGMIK